MEIGHASFIPLKLEIYLKYCPLLFHRVGYYSATATTQFRWLIQILYNLDQNYCRISTRHWGNFHNFRQTRVPGTT